MSWERRGDRWVYYRARRVNGRVVKDYRGTGFVAELEAEEDAQAREERRSTLTVYQATRHTFGAQWVIAGGSLHKLAAVLGHSSTEVTVRYGHLVPGEYSPAERALVDLDLHPAQVLPMRKGG